MSNQPDHSGPLDGPTLRKRSDLMLANMTELMYSAQQMAYTAGSMDACDLLRVLLTHVEKKGKFETPPAQPLDVFTLKYVINALHSSIQNNVNNIVVTDVVVVPGSPGTEGPPPGTKLS